MKLKKVLRKDSVMKKFRLARLMWVKGAVGAGGYSACLSLALERSFFCFKRDVLSDWRLCLFGLSIHYNRSYGGYHV